MDFYKEYLKDDLALVQRHLRSVFHVEGVLMREVAEYVVGLQGKMMRPAMVCLTARALGFEGTKDAHQARLGAAVELFHVATLLHDDVIDGASLRRGRATVNAKWGNDVSILFADYLYASSFDHALAVLNPEVVQVLTRTTQRMAEGELYQIEKRGAYLGVEDYYRIIRAKTAYLFSACCGLGAMLAGSPPDVTRRFFDFGLNFGMAFQITDDALDYEATGESWGKKVGSDLAEGKQTLPLLYTLQEAKGADRDLLVRTLENGRDFETVHALVRRYNAIDYTLEKAGEYTRAASELLDGLPENEALALLRRINDGVLARQY